MQKLIFTLCTWMLISNECLSQNWDRHMEVKKMSILVKTDAFTATTFIEMEFYNPTNTEMEGLYRFTLEPGQAITAFQLDLFGKYRDGSIEEKWKATNAYNTIVGKRVDPALLTMDSYNNYSLRIYPVPAMSSRKITMTIQQLLILEKEKAIYKLPLNIRDTIRELNVQIDVEGSTGFPSVIKGLLQDESFGIRGNQYDLALASKGVKAEKPLSFSIPLSAQQHVLCLKSVDGKAFFALRLKPSIRREYTIQPKKVTVFWDISNSGSRRSISREAGFLQQYVTTNNITQLAIISFNQQVQDTAVFYTANNFNSRWVEYLQSLKYEGATQFGSLDFSRQDADAILVFSDGKNSFGSALPTPGRNPVYCINSAAYPDPVQLQKITGLSGGCYIDLIKVSMNEAIAMAGKAENILLAIQAGDTKLNIDQQTPDLKEEVLLLTGIIPANEKMITLSYGNNGNTREEEKIAVTADNTCAGSAIDRIRMLSLFDAYAKSTYWMSALEFGKAEKVVTLNTAFIVLEKVEDYIKFTITPPKELESQCDMNIFVKAEEERRKQYKQLGEQEILTMVAQSYNVRIATWDRDQQPINMAGERNQQRLEKDKKTATPSTGAVQDAGTKGPVTDNFSGREDMSMSEVVVTALGQARQPKELGYSVSRITAAELTQAHVVNVQNGLTGKVSGLNVTTVNSGVFGDTRITLRGIRSLTGNNQPLLVLDGVPISLQYLNAINPHDVRDVTVLKSPSATAIYGPDGANGALIITTKKGNRGWYSNYWGTYKLKNQEDEDYLAEIKQTTSRNKPGRYQELKKIHGDQAGFYFDMAQHLFESGYRQNALTILYSASEVAGGDKQVLKAMGYTLEAWKEFGEAIKIYRQLIDADGGDARAYRDLALALYQDGKYQQSVNTFYEGILKNYDTYEYYRKEIKAMMLQEMNAIIAIHGTGLDLSAINKELIRPLSLDLRIVLDCNSSNLGNSVSVREPGGALCSNGGPSSNGGQITSYYNYYYGLSDHLQEYQVKQAKTGKYKINVQYKDHYHGGLPAMIRITTFRNFGKPGQSLEIENVIMDNQYGDVEIAEVTW